MSIVNTGLAIFSDISWVQLLFHQCSLAYYCVPVSIKAIKVLRVPAANCSQVARLVRRGKALETKKNEEVSLTHVVFCDSMLLENLPDAVLWSLFHLIRWLELIVRQHLIARRHISFHDWDNYRHYCTCKFYTNYKNGKWLTFLFASL